MSPIEVMARAICNATDYDGNPLDGHFHIKELREFATAALLALSQMEPTPGMVEAGINAAEVDHNDLDLAMANAFRAMLASAVKEIEGSE